MPNRRLTILLLPDVDPIIREGQGDMTSAESAAAALGCWVYANRASLGLEIELITPRGRAVK